MNVASVSWGDHLAFGDGDGRLSTPDALARRMDRWRDALEADTLHWRVLRTSIPGRFQSARGYEHPTLARSGDVQWEALEIVPRLARSAGFTSFLYVSLFDEGWPLAPPSVRRVSYHNAMHGQHVAWQSDFSRQHPQYACVDRTGTLRQWGVLSLSYDAVRSHFIERFLTWMRVSDFDGLFLCLRSQSKPADFADQFGFDAPVRQEFERRFGSDIVETDFDVMAWRGLLGECLTRFLRELRAPLQQMGRRLAVGVPRGDILGPPLGNTTLDWRTWVGEAIVDDLVINQNSSRCPSMWHALWPMHRGYGYVQDYVSGRGMPPLGRQLDLEYGAALAGTSASLYVARQWCERDAEEETRLLSHPAVTGLVHSTFRFDNAQAVARGDWRA